MACGRKAKMGISALFMVIFAAIVVFGFIFPGLVKQMQDDGVKKAVIINQDKMSSSSWDTFVNSTTTVQYYVYNITNLRDVMLTGAKIKVNQVGPYTITKRKYKRLVDASDETNIKYLALNLYDLDPAQLTSMNNDPIIIPNTLYFAALAKIGQGQQQSVGAPMTGNPDISETNFLFAPKTAEQNIGQAIGATAFPQFYSNFIQEDGQLLTSVRIVSLANYFSTGIASIVQGLGAFGVNTSLAKAEWGSGAAAATTVLVGGQNFSYAIRGGAGATAFTGFELSAPLSKYNASEPGFTSLVAQVDGLWNPSNTKSLGSQSGAMAWANYFGLAQKLGKFHNATLAAATDLAANTGLTFPNDFTIVANWILGLAIPTNNPYYLAFVTGGINKLNGQYNTSYNTAHFQVNSWSDIGAFQWGTGYVTTLLGGASTASLAANGFPTTVNALSDPLGYTNSWAPEFATALTSYTTPTALPTTAQLGGGKPSMSIAAAKALLTALNSESTLTTMPNVVPGTIYILLLQYFKQMQNPALTYAAFVAAVIPQVLNGLKTNTSAIPGYQSIFNNAQIALDFKTYQPWMLPGSSLSPAAVCATYGGLLSKYFLNSLGANQIANQLYGSSGYIKVLPGDIDNYGLNARGAALFPMFLKRTAYEIFFGYTDAATGTAIPGIVARPSDIRTWQTEAAQLAALEQEDTPLYYSQNTGRTNLDDVGKLSAYHGWQYIQYRCDYDDPLDRKNCTKSNAPGAANWNIWSHQESIVGTGDGSQFKPFQEDSLIPEVRIFVSEARRTLRLPYSGNEIKFKGITLRRYIVDPAVLVNSTDSARTNYSSGSLKTGLVNIMTGQRGIPLVISQPHFYNADPSINAAIIDTVSPSQELHDTHIDVEPISGKTMNIHKRLQANFWINKYIPANADHGAQDFTLTNYYSNVWAGSGNELALPYYWADEHAEIEDSDASAFRQNIYYLRDLSYDLMIALPIGGGILFFVSLYMFIRAYKGITSKRVAGRSDSDAHIAI